MVVLRSLLIRYPRLKFVLAGVLVLGVLIGGINARSAQAATPQSFIVMVGAATVPNTDLLQFAPGTLKVHRGDTVTWVNQGFHNVHVGATKPVELVIAPQVDGKPLPQINPAIVYPFGPKSGEKYTGGEAGSGVPLGPDASPVYSLVIDVNPGTTLAVVCDIHPGMAMSVSVVGDSETIPTPYEVTLQAASEFGASAGAVGEAASKAMVESGKMMNATDGKATVQMGLDVGRAANLLFYPFATVIKAGDSVTWKFGDAAVEPHTVTAAQVAPSLEEFVPIPQKTGPPVISVGPGLAPMTKEGEAIKAGGTFHSGLLVPVPGKLPTFTLQFTEPGVYPYVCRIHPGMNGVVIVNAK